MTSFAVGRPRSSRLRALLCNFCDTWDTFGNFDIVVCDSCQKENNNNNVKLNRDKPQSRKQLSIQIKLKSGCPQSPITCDMFGHRLAARRAEYASLTALIIASNTQRGTSAGTSSTVHGFAGTKWSRVCLKVRPASPWSKKPGTHGVKSLEAGDRRVEAAAAAAWSKWNRLLSGRNTKQRPLSSQNNMLLLEDDARRLKGKRPVRGNVSDAGNVAKAKR